MRAATGGSHFNLINTDTGNRIPKGAEPECFASDLEDRYEARLRAMRDAN